MAYLGQRRRRAQRRAMHGMGGLARPPIVLAATPPPPAGRLMVGSSVQQPAPWEGVRRIGMSGVSSRPPGASISRGALGDGPPHWYTAMYGASLGDDAADAAGTTPVLTDGTAQWQGAMLQNSTQLLNAWQDYIRKDQIARYVQVAATLSIPLAAALWRMIFKSGGRGDGG